jgi:hypothetical protein
MEQLPGLPPSPEEGERLRINTIIIPADDEMPLEQGKLDPMNIQSYQWHLGGTVQALDLDRPAASLYCNEEGKLEGLPFNGRATMLLWMHNPALRFHDAIVGDALVVGPVSARGRDTDVPDAFTQMFFGEPRLKVEVRVRDNPTWHGNDMRFRQWTEAYAYLLMFSRRWGRAVTDIRVVPDE